MPSRPSPSPLELEELLLLARPQAWGCPLLDLRPEPLARRWALPGSAWWPYEREIPSHLLPPRGQMLAVFAADPTRARARAGALCSRGYRARWSPEAFDDARLPPLGSLPWQSGPPSGALWSPDPYLFAHRDLLPSPSTGPAADLGAGNGRNSVFLAQLGYRVSACDRLPDALDLARDRASHHNVKVRTYQIKLIEPGDIPGGAFGILLFLRFHTKRLIRGALERLSPGGVLVLNTYRSESKEDRAHRLPPKLLSEWLPADQWEFLDGPEAHEEEGKKMVALIARRRR